VLTHREVSPNTLTKPPQPMSNKVKS